MNKRRQFLFASGALVTTLATPAIAAQNGTKKFKVTVNYIPGLVNVGNVLNGGGGDKKEKEVVVEVEAEELGQVENYWINKNADGFFRVEGKTEIVAIPVSSITRYTVSPA